MDIKNETSLDYQGIVDLAGFQGFPDAELNSTGFVQVPCPHETEAVVGKSPKKIVSFQDVVSSRYYTTNTKNLKEIDIQQEIMLKEKYNDEEYSNDIDLDEKHRMNENLEYDLLCDDMEEDYGGHEQGTKGSVRVL